MYKEVQYIPTGTVNPNAISITKTGRINLNRHYVKRYSLQKNMRVKLLWDETENKIALIFVDADEPGSFPLVFVPSGQAAYIIANQFFRSYRLDPTKYAAPYNFEISRPEQLGIPRGEDEVFIIDLKRPIS